MKRRLKEPFGKAGLMVAVLALVVGMAGGAYAAGGLSKSQEKQVTKIAKKYAGPAGKPGANGTNGSNGAAGAKGDAGDAGGPGSPGAAGTSVTSTALAKGNANCKEGGSEFVSASGKTFACNGTTGFTKTLPVGSTETGAWAFGPTTAAAVPSPPVLKVTVASFAIPLTAPLGPSKVHYINVAGKEVIENPTTEEPEEVGSAACAGDAEAPKAESGNLCLYAANEEGSYPVFGFERRPTSSSFRNPGSASAETGAGTTGALLNLFITGNSTATGTWAVTG